MKTFKQFVTEARTTDLATHFHKHAEAFAGHAEEGDPSAKRSMKRTEERVRQSHGEGVVDDMKKHSEHLFNHSYAQDHASHDAPAAHAIREKHGISHEKFKDFEAE